MSKKKDEIEILDAEVIDDAYEDGMINSSVIEKH